MDLPSAAVASEPPPPSLNPSWLLDYQDTSSPSGIRCRRRGAHGADSAPGHPSQRQRCMPTLTFSFKSTRVWRSNGIDEINQPKRSSEIWKARARELPERLAPPASSIWCGLRLAISLGWRLAQHQTRLRCCKYTHIYTDVHICIYIYLLTYQ